MASRRTKSISTKVTPEEYAHLVALAGDETISEWARGVLLRAHAPSATETALLAELLALRTILLNLHFAICGGEPLSAEAMQRFITRADQDKHRLANERLHAAIDGRQPRVRNGDVRQMPACGRVRNRCGHSACC